MDCPSCKSENTQTIQMVVMSGTSSGRSFGGGVTSELDVGVGTMSSKNVTALAESLKPGMKPPTAAGCLIPCIIVCLIIGSIIWNSDGKPLGPPFFVMAAFFGWALIKKKDNGKSAQLIKEWEHKNALYERGWICHRCGHKWLP